MTTLTLYTNSGPIHLVAEEGPPLEPLTGAKVTLTFADGTQLEAQIEGLTGLAQEDR